jgi:hypothetical protein
LGAVSVDVVEGELAGVGGSEVGPVPAEDQLPRLACVGDAVGDQVGGVGGAAAGHRDVGRGGAGVVGEDEVRGRGGLALGAVDGDGVGQFHMLAYVGGRDAADLTAGGRQLQGPVGADGGDGPGLPVRDAQVAVVEPGGDPVADAEAFPGVGDHGLAVVDMTGGDEPVPDGAVQRRDLFTGIGEHQPTPGVLGVVASPPRLSARIVATARSAMAWVRSASEAWRTISPRASRVSKTAPECRPVRMAKERSA